MKQLIIFLLLPATVCAQLITKKESAAIDQIIVDASAVHKPATYLIRGATIITMRGQEVLEHHDVLVKDGVIGAVGQNVDAGDAIVIDGSGKYLLPGLADMHVHLFDRHALRNTWMLALLLHGVTTVRDMCGETGKLALREKIKSNELLAPNLYQAGPIIDGVKDNMGLFALATTPEQGRAAVQNQKKAGYDFVKVYDHLQAEVYAAIADEAHKQQMLVAGHMPDAVALTGAATHHQNTIEHLTGYFEWKENQVSLTAPADYATLTAKAGVWNCPTLYNHYMNGSRKGAADMFAYAYASGLVPKSTLKLWEKRINNNSKAIEEIVDRYGAGNYAALSDMVRALYQAGAPLVAGTDAGNLPLLIPGYALHEELKLMAATGIPVHDVLKMATINAAVAMGKQDEFGSIEAGKRADLLLLNANPLNSINRLQDKAGLMVRGVWLSAEALEKMMTDIREAFGD